MHRKRGCKNKENSPSLNFLAKVQQQENKVGRKGSAA